MTTLDEFRPGAVAAPATKARAKKKPEWQPPTLEAMAYDQLLCFDPSLSATGFVALAHTPSDGLQVLQAQAFKGTAADGLTGWEATMAEAEDLEDQLDALMTRYSRHEWSVAIEQPPAGGGKISRPEAAILACKTIRSVFRRGSFRRLPMMSPQSHKRSTVNRPHAKKAEHHALLMPWLAGLPVEGLELITNEAKRDAISVGVASLLREGR